MKLFNTMFTIAGIGFLVLAVVVFIFIMVSPNAYRDRRDYEAYYHAVLAEESRSFPLSSFNIGPKTVPTSYVDMESVGIYVGRDGDPAMSYTEAYYAEGGRYLGYYQLRSTGGHYSDGFVPHIAEWKKITKEEFLEHVQ